MCGIVGYTGDGDAARILLSGLSNLEYRGYDSAGVSIVENGHIRTVKAAGRLTQLEERMGEEGCPHGNVGIGHTRWATHGVPSDANSHPHATQRLSLVHNGIIENYLELKDFLTHAGYCFTSETDTEVAAKLIDHCYDGDPAAAIRRAMERLEGSYAFAVLFHDRPDTIYAVRKDSPLIVGLGDGENFIASDVPAILEHTGRYHLLEEGELAQVKANSVSLTGPDGSSLPLRPRTADWTLEQAQKGGYAHFMDKEMHEQPKALVDTLHPRIKNSLPDFSSDGIGPGFFSRYGSVCIMACGTARHAGMVGKSIIERLARVPVEVDLASECRYRDPILADDCLAVVISQSGETADTLAALRLAKSRGIDTLAVVNVTGSSIAREADHVILTHAGPEIAVASTKGFTVQMGIMYLLAITMAWERGRVDTPKAAALCAGLLDAAEKTRQVLDRADALAPLVAQCSDSSSLFYLGRGVDYALAMEGSLKLKEISYLHSEAYAAGELKHGAISLITDGVPVVALITQSALLPKLVSNIKEARARGAAVLVVAGANLPLEEGLCDHVVRLPVVEEFFLPLPAAVVLQLLAYHAAVARGCDVDKPRNLAKSVTVE